MSVPIIFLPILTVKAVLFEGSAVGGSRHFSSRLGLFKDEEVTVFGSSLV